jgi:hypothetical protein
MYEKKKASALTLASRNSTQTKSYHRHFGESRKILKMRIGETLLRLIAVDEQPDTWQQFDQFMRQLYAGGAV